MRVSTVVLAFSCLVMAFMLVGNRVNAQDDHSPVRRFPGGMYVGTRVIVHFSANAVNGGGAISCTLAAIDSGWFRCAPPSPNDAFNKDPQEWYDIAHVVTVQKVETER